MVDSLIHFLGWSLVIPAYAKQLLLAGVIGICFGFERELNRKPASLRTFSTISVGSCLFTILSVQAIGGPNALPHDITRIAAQIVTGIGFVGGGVIFKTQDRVEGITTASLIWLTAALGMACGFNDITLVTWSLVIAVWVHLVCFICFSFIYREPDDKASNRRQPQINDNL